MLRKISFILIAALLGTTLILGMGSAEAATKVKPTGDPVTDVARVQKAVDKGGTVILEAGTFNFGTKQVIVSKDVIIQGEGDLATTINGGAYAFQVTTPSTDLPSVTIQNLHFYGFNTSAMRLHRFEEAIIQDNKFENGIIERSNVSNLKALFGIAIVGPGLPGFGPGHIGTTVVKSNEFNMRPDGSYNGPDTADVAYATAIFLTDIAEDANNSNSYITIDENTIMNPGTAGICIYAIPGVQSLNIIGNTIIQRKYGFSADCGDWSDWMKSEEAAAERALSMSIGIYATGFRVGTQTTKPIQFSGYPKTGKIEGNTILNCPTRGIVLANAQNFVVKDNDIEMVVIDEPVESSAAIALTADHFCGLPPDNEPFPETQNNSFDNNTITGTADYGVTCNDRTKDNTFKFYGVNPGDIKIQDRGTDNEFEFE